MNEVEKSNEVDTEALKANVKTAKDAAKKHIKTVDDAKKFVEKNKEKIEVVSSKLKGKDKENFDKVVAVLSDEKMNESDTALKTICGLTAVVAWLLGFPTAALVAASPIYAPVLSGVVGRLTSLKESDDTSCNEDDVHDGQVHDETELILDIPGMPPVDVEFEGEWHGVRFAIDLFTDALAHMKAKDPKYAGVSFHVKR